MFNMLKGTSGSEFDDDPIGGYSFTEEADIREYEKKPELVTGLAESKLKTLSFQTLFGGWSGQDLAMDLGTANTLIYIRGKGIVLNEPSVVAVREEDRKTIAVGQVAKEMYGKTSHRVRCVRPLKDGVIADFDMTHLMIKDFLTRVSKKWQIRRPRLIVSVPSGITMVESEQ